MTFRNILPPLLLIAVLLAGLPCPALASYAGDRPLVEVFREEFQGGYHFTLGNSTYTGSLAPGNRTAIELDPGLPEGASIRFARLYLYWAWSGQGQLPVHPNITVSVPGHGPLPLVHRYLDSKGFASKNDFFSGMDAYDPPPLSPAARSIVITAENTAPENRTFVIQGAGLLVAYEKAGLPRVHLRIHEGADLLYSSYGITPAMATSGISLEGTIPAGSAGKATLLLVAPSGGYTRSGIVGMNRLLVNRAADSHLPPFLEALVSLLFPSATGKEWTDIFDSDELVQVGIEKREITPFLREKENVIAVQDSGDYLVLTNSILELRLRGEGSL
ncbi:MAG TPA: DUF3344 domain-containing protein [Methanomicrobiales archaeon]|nr:DUF3344 domain-containing protein [Methanomicrobiales archaeon]